jgi:hypothetical protein
MLKHVLDNVYSYYAMRGPARYQDAGNAYCNRKLRRSLCFLAVSGPKVFPNMVR